MSRARDGAGLHVVEFLIGEFTVRVFAHGFEYGNDIEILFFSFDFSAARKNGAAVYKYSRAIHAAHGHYAGRHVFVTAADGYEAIHTFTADNGLDGIGDNLTGYE